MYYPRQIHQTAGESQYQDQPTGYRSSNPFSPLGFRDYPKTDPATNPFAPPPPMLAPPSPPPSESDNASVRSVGFAQGSNDDESSIAYRTATPPRDHRYPVNGGRSTTGSTGDSYYPTYQSSYASIPAITNYGISPAQNFFPTGTSTTSDGLSRYLTGDTTVRPNTGQTNDEIGGLGSLREVTSRLRWITVSCTMSALIWEGFAFPARLLVHTWDHPSKVVLGGYLAFFCLLLLGVELNAPLRDLFGVLYHPLGRGFLLALLSTMCYGISIAWWELLLCVAFAGCSGGYVFAYIKYPEYRRWQDYNDNRIWSDMRQAAQARGYGNTSTTGGNAYWVDPVLEGSARQIIGNNQSWERTQREAQSLLHQI